MKKTAYIRVSSSNQTYARQQHDLTEYFNRSGIDINTIDFVQEKITSYTSFRERAIYPILKKAKPGDIVYVCQLDRLGRTVEDIIQLVKFADAQGVELYAIKEGQRITYKTNTGKMMLTLLAMVAEMERELRAERCQSGIEAAKAEIAKNGFRIARCSGKVQKRLGNEKGCDMSAAVEASCQHRTDAAILWRESSKAYRRALRKRAEGWSVTQITADLSELYDENPEDYGTPTGCKPSKGTVSKWLREASPIAV